MPPAEAKTPGEVHCYNDICHRVKSLEEMRLLVGQEFEATASFYDIPERDRFNTGTLTSSGEAFDAWSDSHAASSVYPDGTELLLWNPKNGRASHVRVNDFGPFYKRRTIDVTRGVAEKLDFARFGVTTLKVIVIWAPDSAHARYRRERIYPSVGGFLGRFDEDQLTPLRNRLIAQAPERNGQQPAGSEMLAAAKPLMEPALAELQPAHSLDQLPAYAHPEADSAASAMAVAHVRNTPRYHLSVRTPDALMHAKGPIAFAPNTSPKVLIAAASPIAIAASSTPASVLPAGHQRAAAAIASLDHGVTTAADHHAEPAPTLLTASFLDAWKSSSHGPSNQLWQQLLVALGVFSAAAASWRMRKANGEIGRTQVAAFSATRVREADAIPTAMSGFGLVAPTMEEVGVTSAKPTATLTYGTVVPLPLLPQRPVVKTDEALREEVAAALERFDFVTAELTLRQLLAQRERVHGLDHPLTAIAERQLADCLREQGRFASAEPYYRRALAGMMLAAGDVHPAVADVLDEYAVCLLRQGRAGDARGLARQALAIRRIAGSYCREYAVTLTIVAEANRAQGNLSEAETEHRNAWSQFIAVSGQDSLDAAASMMSLGTVLSEIGKFQAAEDLLNAGVRVVTEACGGDHPASASAYALLGDLYHRAGHRDAAHTMHSYAHTIRARVLGPRHLDTIESLLTLSTILTEQFRMDEARDMLDRALDGLARGDRQSLGPQSRIRRLLVTLGSAHDTRGRPAMAAE